MAGNRLAEGEVHHMSSFSCILLTMAIVLFGLISCGEDGGESAGEAVLDEKALAAKN